MVAGILVFSTLLLLLLKVDLASCQMCNDIGFYCVSNTTFRQCVDNNPPSGPLNFCHVGTFCSMDCPLECLETIPCTTTTTEIPSTTILFTTTTEIPSTTIFTTTTEFPLTTVTITTEVPFVCTASGRFVDPTNCTNYYMCSPTSSGGFYQYLYPCPGGSVFNPGTSKCTIDSTGTICSSASSTTSSTAPTSTSTPSTPSSSLTPPSSSSTTSSTSTTTTTVSPIFRCAYPGRFPHSQDCTKYYLCSSDGNGGYYQYLYTCPISSVFNPVTAKCATSSVCL